MWVQLGEERKTAAKRQTDGTAVTREENSCQETVSNVQLGEERKTAAKRQTHGTAVTLEENSCQETDRWNCPDRRGKQLSRDSVCSWERKGKQQSRDRHMELP